MCGIAGIFNDNDVSAVEEMMAAVRHRGPDGQGLWGDPHPGGAHPRLSIIDIEGGAQPMSSPEACRHTGPRPFPAIGVATGLEASLEHLPQVRESFVKIFCMADFPEVPN